MTTAAPASAGHAGEVPALTVGGRTAWSVATIPIRAAAVIVIAATLFLGPTTGGLARMTQIAGFAVGAATTLVWAGVGWRRQGRWRAAPGVADSGRATAALFAVMAIGSLGCSSDHGGVLITFALFAAVAAGSQDETIPAALVAALGVLVVIVGAIGVDASPTATLGRCLEVVVALLLGLSRRSARVRGEQAALLLTQADQLRIEQTRVATLRERARIAREIHDVLAHSLGALNIQLQAARALLSHGTDIERAEAVLSTAQRIAADGLEDTRRAVHALRSDSGPLDDELVQLAATHRATHDVPVQVTVRGVPRPITPEARLALMRAAQESLVNAAKHAPGRPIRLDLTHAADAVHLQIVNDLPTDTPVHAAGHLRTVDGGYGLTGMRERLLLVHGSLTAAEHAGTWTVTAQVPR